MKACASVWRLRVRVWSWHLESLSLVRWLRELSWTCESCLVQGAGAGGDIPSPGLPDKQDRQLLGAVVLLWELPACAISSATASRGLHPHTLSEPSGCSATAFVGNTAQTEHLSLTGLVETLLWFKMSRIFLACVPTWLSWKVRSFVMESWAWVLRG